MGFDCSDRRIEAEGGFPRGGGKKSLPGVAEASGKALIARRLVAHLVEQAAHRCCNALCSSVASLVSQSGTLPFFTTFLGGSV